MSGRKVTRGMDYTHFSEVGNVCLFTDIAMLMFFHPNVIQMKDVPLILHLERAADS